MLKQIEYKMKKIVMLFAAAAMTVSVAFAQDINAVTETYNNGAMELEMGNKEAALGYFQAALTEAEALGEAGMEIAENCKMTIPVVMISLANDLIEASEYDAAAEWLTKAEEAAALYGDTEKAADAAAKKNQILMKKAADLLKAKDYANAIVVYEQIMAIDPTNGRAALQMGQAYNASGNQEKAEEAFNVAAANGQEKQANKQLSNLYVKKASAALKAKNNQEAFDFAMKSNEYLENANAYKLHFTVDMNDAEDEVVVYSYDAVGKADEGKTVVVYRTIGRKSPSRWYPDLTSVVVGTAKVIKQSGKQVIDISTFVETPQS